MIKTKLLSAIMIIRNGSQDFLMLKAVTIAL